MGALREISLPNVRVMGVLATGLAYVGTVVMAWLAIDRTSTDLDIHVRVAFELQLHHCLALHVAVVAPAGIIRISCHTLLDYMAHAAFLSTTQYEVNLRTIIGRPGKKGSVDT